MKNEKLRRCIEVVKALRDPENGCPWDLKQNHKSLLKYLIEESYEFIEAVENNDIEHMEEELGDVLLQVLLHSTIAEENQNFSLESCAQKLSEKLIHRHPHVFNKNQKRTFDEVLANWDKLKNEEDKKKKSSSVKNYSLKTKLLHAPALQSSYQIGQFSHQVNFDWSTSEEVIPKVEEEWQEVLIELKAKNPQKEKIKEEIGDLLFSISQLARHLNINPEESLRDANKKFINRFHQVEDHLSLQNISIHEASREKMEEAWRFIKKKHSLKNQFIRKSSQERLYQLQVPLIGVTGGIATGKTTFSQFLKNEGYAVIDADKLVKKIYQTKEAQDFISQHFPQVMNKDMVREDKNTTSSIDFGKLREVFFNDQSSKELIENFIYQRLPFVFNKEANDIIKKNHQPFIFYDVPLLFEKSLQSFFDIIILVYSSKEEQLRRLIARDHCSLSVAQKIISSQISIDEKRKNADFIIDNDSNQKNDLKAQTRNLIQTIMN